MFQQPIRQPALPPLSIAEASVADLDSCRRSPIEWVHATLFTLMPIAADSHLVDARLRIPRAPTAYAFVREPTAYARANIFPMFDLRPPPNIHNEVAGILAHRYNETPELPQLARVRVQDFLHVKPEFFSRLFQVTTWQIRRGHPMSATAGFHVLDFATQMMTAGTRMTHLPAEGFPLDFMKRLAKFIWSVMSLPQVEYSQQGVLCDRYFHKSTFGATILQLCLAPFHFALDPWWMKYQRVLTGLWFSDLVDVFDLFASFVEPKTVSGMGNMFLPMESSLHPFGALVCTSVESRGAMGAPPENFLVTLHFLAKRIEERWFRPIYYEGEDFFKSSVPPVLFPSTVTIPRDDTVGQKTEQRTSVPSDKDDLPAQPFIAAKPLFLYVGTNGVVPAGKTPHDMLRDQANIRQWVKLKPARQRQGKPGTSRQICFQCAFVSSNKCPDKSKCKAGSGLFRRKRDGPQRLHIDLSHRDWSTYPKENWKPLIDFQNEHSAWIRPSEHLLALVPDGWKLE